MTATRTVPTPRPTPVGRATRGRYVFAVSACVLAIVAIVVLGIVLSNNVVYFRSVSEAVEQRTSQGTARFRLAGAVVPGTIRETRAGVRFEVTDGEDTVAVVHRGGQPSLFEEGAPVVCEGRWSSGRSGPFLSDRIMIRHGNEYTPPTVKVDARS